MVIEGLLVGGLVQTSSLYVSEYYDVLKRNEKTIVFHREWIAKVELKTVSAYSTNTRT